MQRKDDRALIYAALLLIGSVVGLIIGPAVALWTVLQVAIVVGLLFWLGTPAQTQRERRTR
jgi:p-aminobenzoyl-glutamate transporter AbgT